MEFLTVARVAERLRRNVRLIQRWIQEGRLEAERVGPLWLVSEEQLSRFQVPPRKWSTRPKPKGRRAKRHEA